MAFAYRNPTEAAINALPSKFSDQLLSTVGDHLESKMDSLNSFFSFSVSKEVEEFLTSVGLTLAPILFGVHTHPACKMIENHIVYRVVPQLLNKCPSIAFMSMREEKTREFIKVRNFSRFGKLQNVFYVNSNIVAKDSLRYQDPHLLPRNFDEALDKLEREIAIHVLFPKTIFVHDEMHYWEPEKLLQIFTRFPELREIVGTVICPIELLLGDKSSKNPRIYTYELYEDSFFFFPDGVASEGYEQKISTTTWWFKNHTISNSNISLKINLLGSFGAHHIFKVDRSSLATINLPLCKPPCLLDSELEIFGSDLIGGTIERNTMSSILVYLSCLKSPNRESALAKLRQLEKRQLFPDEAYLVSTIAQTFMEIDFGSSLKKNWKDWTIESLKDLLPSFVLSFVDLDRQWQLKSRLFMKDITIKHIIFKRKSLSLIPEPVIPEPIPSTSDRPSSPYCLLKKSFRYNPSVWIKPFPFLCNGVIVVSKAREVVCQRRCFPIPPKNPKRMFLEWDGSFEANPLKEETSQKKESFSKDGVVIQPEMLVNEFVNPAGNFLQRKNACVFIALGKSLNEDPEELMNFVFNCDISGDLFDAIDCDQRVSLDMIHELSAILDCKIYVRTGGSVRKFNLEGRRFCGIVCSGAHAEPMEINDLRNLVASDSKTSKGKEVKESLVAPLGSPGSKSIDLAAACKLMKSFSRGTTGILRESSGKNAALLDELADLIENLPSSSSPFPYNYNLILGIAGSGKTSGLIKRLTSNPMSQHLIVSPRRALASEWSEQLKGTSHRVNTFESSLFNVSLGLKGIVFDEATLYPPGFIDLCILMQLLMSNKVINSAGINHSKLKRVLSENSLIEFGVFVLGDPMQNFYYGELDSILLGHKRDLIEMIKLSGSKVDYLFSSYRLPKGFESIIDFQCLGDGPFETFKVLAETFSPTVGAYDALLVASFEDKKRAGGPLPVLTYGESQGLTFNKKVLIGISNDTLRSSPNALIVALTRSKIGFDFALMCDKDIKEIIKVSKKKLLGYILSREKVSESKILTFCEIENVNLVKRCGSLEEKASNDPFILPFVDICQDSCLEEKVNPIEFHYEWMKTHLPIISVNPLLSECFDLMKAKEKREFWHHSVGCSEQFPDDDSRLIEDHMGYGFRFDAIFPRHNGRDDVTFWEGVKKRLRFSNPREERRKFEEASKISDKLLSIFTGNLPGPFEVNDEDIELARRSFNEKRAEKSANLWKAHAERSDIDWDLNRIFLFMKAQLCTKQEKMFSDAKAGQTLACFQHIVLFKFGPMLRAIERAFIRACGTSFYIHSGKNFFSLNEFILINSDMFQGKSIESDYESFDSCQDAVILAFEVSLLKKIGVSTGFIEDYKFIKMNLGCRLGSLAIMRFTGEFCTFLFNTFSNMLFTFLKYEVNHKRDRILFAGDDMASIGGLKRRSGGISLLLDHFSLKAKEKVVNLPCFCGWYLTPEGIVKSPSLLWARICVMKQRGLINSCLDSYFLEAVFAYNLGEKLFDFFDEKEIEYHYIISRFFVQNKFKFSGEAKRLAFGASESFGCKCQSSKLMTSPSEQSLRTLKLTQLSHQISTGMHPFLGQRSFSQYEGLKVISKFAPRMLRVLLSQTSSFLMKLKSNKSEAGQRSTHTSTWEQSFSASHHSFRTTGNYQGELCCMMAQPWTSSQGLLECMTSTSRMVQPSLFSGRNIFCPPQTHSSLKPSDLPSTYLESISQLKGRFLGSTLDAFTECRVPQDSSPQVQGKGAGLNKKFEVVRSLNMIGRRLRAKGLLVKSTICRKLGLIRKSQTEVSACQAESPEEEGIFQPLGQKPDQLIRACLGQPPLSLKVVMAAAPAPISIQEEIRSVTRQEITQHLWASYIKPRENTISQMERITTCAETNKQNLKTILSHYLSYLFGNVALLGTSSKTQWPNVTVRIPGIRIPWGAENFDLQWEINLSVIIPDVETYKSAHTNPLVSGQTLRQICEHFASEAYHFLKRVYAQGVSTNIYRKWPRALESAPWVAFDFCGGLNMSQLSPDEKKVVDRLTKRLFRTEGQKGVFEAGQEVNVDLEG
uniref:Polyprotein n=1 Tax=Linum macraei betaflexivirus TaxID=2933101 RepID=A0A9C7LLQ9_9VIRU|nr:polyprotein [Linum macraei betaflexivirus]CAI5385154.1 polyprotein [Linum macraei betaflexivirus]